MANAGAIAADSRAEQFRSDRAPFEVAELGDRLNLSAAYFDRQVRFVDAAPILRV